MNEVGAALREKVYEIYRDGTDVGRILWHQIAHEEDENIPKVLRAAVSDMTAVLFNLDQFWEGLVVSPR